jgi:hypothetical protein
MDDDYNANNKKALEIIFLILNEFFLEVGLTKSNNLP